MIHTQIRYTDGVMYVGSWLHQRELIQVTSMRLRTDQEMPLNC